MEFSDVPWFAVAVAAILLRACEEKAAIVVIIWYFVAWHIQNITNSIPSGASPSDKEYARAWRSPCDKEYARVWRKGRVQNLTGDLVSICVLSKFYGATGNWPMMVLVTMPLIEVLIVYWGVFARHYCVPRDHLDVIDKRLDVIDAIQHVATMVLLKDDIAHALAATGVPSFAGLPNESRDRTPMLLIWKAIAECGATARVAERIIGCPRIWRWIKMSNFMFMLYLFSARLYLSASELQIFLSAYFTGIALPAVSMTRMRGWFMSIFAAARLAIKSGCRAPIRPDPKQEENWRMERQENLEENFIAVCEMLDEEKVGHPFIMYSSLTGTELILVLFGSWVAVPEFSTCLFRMFLVFIDVAQFAICLQFLLDDLSEHLAKKMSLMIVYQLLESATGFQDILKDMSRYEVVTTIGLFGAALVEIFRRRDWNSKAIDFHVPS